MSRTLGFLRPLAVWVMVSAAAALAIITAPAAWRTSRSSTGAAAVTDLVVAVCATGLAVALVWLWLVTTTTVVGLLRGRIPTRGTTRRLVLLACGVAVVAGTSAPAMAAGGDGREVLAGLSLPERAVAPTVHRAAPGHAVPSRAASSVKPTASTYVVRPGDSLSSIALAHPGDGSLDDRWRAIWHANRDVVGADPDLILPGQALRLPRPASPDTTHTDQDGDR